MLNNRVALMRPFLSATHDRKYAGQGASGELPYQGVIVGHTNLPEWEKFCALPESKAFRDRMCEIMVPYCVRLTEEQQLLRHYLAEGGNAGVPIAPGALEMLAEFAVRGRLVMSDTVSAKEKMDTYDGRSIPSDQAWISGAKRKGSVTADDMRAEAEYKDGLHRASERFNYAVISHAVNHDPQEAGLDPVILLDVLAYDLAVMHGGNEDEASDWAALASVLKKDIVPRFNDYVEEVVRNARFENQERMVHSKIDRYALLADAYIEESPVQDDLGERTLTREEINKELMKVEKGMNISNPKDLRNEIQNVLLRLRAKGDATSSLATALKADVLQKFTRYFVEAEQAEEDNLEKAAKETKEKKPGVTEFVPRDDVRLRQAHEDFMGRIRALGCTSRQAQRLVKYYNTLQAKKK